MSFLGEAGWARFGADDRSLAWMRTARDAADAAIADPSNAHWLRCEGTWYAGVNLLDTAPTGAIAGVDLAGPAIDALREADLVPQAWDRAQVSVTYPGYPRPMAGESPSAFRYRRDRDAAHVDGLLPVGAERRRMVQEFHGFVLGLPLSEADGDAAPFVVWEGSHRIMAQAFGRALNGISPDDWRDTDLTETYHAARREVFETCRRVAVHCRPGEAYLVHRLALHGVAPWKPGATAEPAGRMIAYFRPEIDPVSWLCAD